MLDAPMRALAARMARDARMADAVSRDPRAVADGLGLSAGDTELLGVVAEARAFHRLVRPAREWPSGAARPES